MSDVVERTLSVLPGLLGQHDPGVGPGGAGGPGRVSATSRLGSLIRSITALTSKHVRAAGGAPPPPSPGPGRAGPRLPLLPPPRSGRAGAGLSSSPFPPSPGLPEVAVRPVGRSAVPCAVGPGRGGGAPASALRRRAGSCRAPGPGDKPRGKACLWAEGRAAWEGTAARYRRPCLKPAGAVSLPRLRRTLVLRRPWS